MSRPKLRRRPPDDAVKAFERALRKRGCPACGSRKTALRRPRAGAPEVALLHTAACPRRIDPFGGDALAAAAASAVAGLRYMASDGGGGGIVQDGAR